jgi:hypothetical protein
LGEKNSIPYPADQILPDNRVGLGDMQLFFSVILLFLLGKSVLFTLVGLQGIKKSRVMMESISKRGDTYLRTLLIYGARRVIRFTKNKIEPEGWLYELITRRNKNIAAVALANINARIIWALLVKGTIFRPGHASAACAAAACSWWII